MANTENHLTKLTSLRAVMPEPVFHPRDDENRVLFLGEMRGNGAGDRQTRAPNGRKGRYLKNTQGGCLRHLAYTRVVTNCAGWNSAEQSRSTGISVSGSAEDGTLPGPILAQATLSLPARGRGNQSLNCNPGFEPCYTNQIHQAGRAEVFGMFIFSWGKNFHRRPQNGPCKHPKAPY